jgi:hypothetical protein
VKNHGSRGPLCAEGRKGGLGGGVGGLVALYPGEEETGEAAHAQNEEEERGED